MFAGIDIGSITSKAVIIDSQNNILAFYILPTSYNRENGGSIVFESALRQIGK